MESLLEEAEDLSLYGLSGNIVGRFSGVWGRVLTVGEKRPPTGGKQRFILKT